MKYYIWQKCPQLFEVDAKKVMKQFTWSSPWGKPGVRGLEIRKLDYSFFPYKLVGHLHGKKATTRVRSICTTIFNMFATPKNDNSISGYSVPPKSKKKYLRSI